MAAVVTAVFYPLNGHGDDLVAALRQTTPAVHDDEGCLLYALHDVADGTITMIEKWQTREILQAHPKGSAVATLDTVGAHLGRPATVITMQPLVAGWTAKGQL